MMHDNLYSDSQTRERLVRGIRKVARAVGSTMGTGGSNAILEAIESPGHIMTNDGYSIANAIHLADSLEEMGRKILVESINRANKASGDGSSTTCILTAAIIDEGLELLNEASPMAIKRSLEECLPDIERSLDVATQKIEVQGVIDLDMLQQVATISAEDVEIGERIAEIYATIGKRGIIHWDVSKTAEDSHTIGSGITVETAGYFSPYMCDATESGQSANQIRIKNPHILLTKQKLASAADFNTIAAALNEKEVKDLVVFADEVDPLILTDILRTRIVRGFRIAIVKMPVLWKDWWYEDLARATGADVIDPVLGLPLKNATLENLGTCGNIVITKDDTYLDGIQDVSEYVQKLEEEGSDDSKLRASRLNTKTARYYVGAHSESALSYRRLKVEDAISAAWQALNGGIVAGGGVALRSIADTLPETVGGRILREALTEPFWQICSNAGVTKVSETLKSNEGYDTRTGEVVDMFVGGIVDPANVVKNAVRNAISVAATVLTASTVVTLPREERTENTPPPALSR